MERELVELCVCMAVETAESCGDRVSVRDGQTGGEFPFRGFQLCGWGHASFRPLKER